MSTRHGNLIMKNVLLLLFLFLSCSSFLDTKQIRLDGIAAPSSYFSSRVEQDFQTWIRSAGKSVQTSNWFWWKSLHAGEISISVDENEARKCFIINGMACLSLPSCFTLSSFSLCFIESHGLLKNIFHIPSKRREKRLFVLWDNVEVSQAFLYDTMMQDFPEVESSLKGNDVKSLSLALNMTNLRNVWNNAGELTEH